MHRVVTLIDENDVMSHFFVLLNADQKQRLKRERE